MCSAILIILWLSVFTSVLLVFRTEVVASTVVTPTRPTIEEFKS